MHKFFKFRAIMMNERARLDGDESNFPNPDDDKYTAAVKALER